MQSKKILLISVVALFFSFGFARANETPGNSVEESKEELTDNNIDQNTVQNGEIDETDDDAEIPDRLKSPTGVFAILYSVTKPMSYLTQGVNLKMGMLHGEYILFSPKYIGEFSLAGKVAFAGQTQSGLTSTYFIGAAGVQYKAQIIQNQVLVPYAGIGYGYSNYSLNLLDVTGTIATQYKGEYSHPVINAGALLLLNVLEPSAASKLYSSFGIKRSMIMLDYLKLAGVDKYNFRVTGGIVSVGLRFEF